VILVVTQQIREIDAGLCEVAGHSLAMSVTAHDAHQRHVVTEPGEYLGYVASDAARGLGDLDRVGRSGRDLGEGMSPTIDVGGPEASDIGHRREP